MRIRPVDTSGLPMPFQRRAGGGPIVGSADPLAWANKADGALHAWDFIANAARWNGAYVGALSSTPNWTFTRASTAYYTNSAGVLIPFGSGALRTGDRGALIEGARTNLCLQSQTFDNAAWTKSQATVSADAVAAPDGTTTADKLVEDTSNAQHRVNQTITVASGTAYAFSIYAKAAERLNINMRMSGTGAVADSSFNLQAGSIAATSNGSAIITALASGWYRCTIVGTSDSTSIICRVNVNSTASSPSQDTYTGDGTSGIYLWGAQLE